MSDPREQREDPIVRTIRSLRLELTAQLKAARDTEQALQASESEITQEHLEGATERRKRLERVCDLLEDAEREIRNL